MYPTEKLAKVALAQIQLLHWRNRVWENREFRVCDKLDCISHYSIQRHKTDGVKVIETQFPGWLYFYDQKTACQFLKDHKSLIEEAKELL